MATQDPTTNYGWDLPADQGDAGLWGAALNTILGDDSTGIDAVVKAVSDVADAALPVAGGTMTGNLKLLTQEMTEVDKGTDGGAIGLDCAAGNFFYLTTNANVTAVTLSNVPSGFFSGVFEINAGGSHTVTWGAAWNWPGGSAPAQTASGRDLYVFYTYDGGTTIYAARAMEDLS
jgi:hypothetical protein